MKQQVTILAIEPSDGLNITKVVFGIDHDMGYREILPLSLSSIKEMFESVLINQSTLQLTKSLFGETFLFEVLKFPGGITVIPPQSAFPLQKFKIVFNFTLNYSIHQIQINFNTLASQLKNGLNLAPYEVCCFYQNISFSESYILKLTNAKKNDCLELDCVLNTDFLLNAELVCKLIELRGVNRVSPYNCSLIGFAKSWDFKYKPKIEAID